MNEHNPSPDYLRGRFDEFKDRTIAEFERCGQESTELRRDMVQLNVTSVRNLAEVKLDVAGLKIKAGVWGLMGGLIPSLIALIWFLLHTKT